MNNKENYKEKIPLKDREELYCYNCGNVILNFSRFNSLYRLNETDICFPLSKESLNFLNINNIGFMIELLVRVETNLREDLKKEEFLKKIKKETSKEVNYEIIQLIKIAKHLNSIRSIINNFCETYRRGG